VSPTMRLSARLMKATETPVGGDRGIPATAVPLRSAGGNAHSLGCAAEPVANEQVRLPVRVSRDEVVRDTVECYVAAIGGHRQVLDDHSRRCPVLLQ